MKTIKGRGETHHKQANNRSVFYGNGTITPAAEIVKNRTSTTEGN